MSDEKRLSVSFGKFTCEIVGYDEPFTIMAKVLEAVTLAAKEAPWIVGGPEGAETDGHLRFAAALSENARSFDLSIDQVDGRFIVSKPDQTEAKAPTTDETPEPEARETRKPLHLNLAETDASEAVENAEKIDDAIAVEETVVVAESEDASEITADEITADEGETSESVEPASVEAVEAVAEVSVEAEPAPQVMEDVIAEAVTEEELADAPEEVAEEVNAADSEAEPQIAASGEAPEIEDPKADEAAVASKETPKAEAEARRSPRIIINREKSKTHPRRYTTATFSSTVLPDAPAEETAEDEKTEVVAEDALETLVLQPAETAKRPMATAKRPEEDESENFLFAPDAEDIADEEPLELEAPLELSASAMAPRSEPVKEEAASKPKKRLGPLSLGIFRRNKDTVVDDGDHPDDDAAFDRLRETAEASIPKLEERTRDILEGAPERKLFAVSDSANLDDADSPAAFARQMGAQSLQDLLEASAAFVAIVDGKTKFSRRDVMQTLSSIGMEKEYTPEARLKSFRKLVTSGAIVRADDGMFAISHATRFGYETQLRANG